LDSNIGIETIVVVSSNKPLNKEELQSQIQNKYYADVEESGGGVIVQTIHHSSYGAIASANSILMPASGVTEVSLDSHISQDMLKIVSQSVGVINSNSKEASLIASAIDEAEESVTTRGVKDVHIYKTAAPSVVFIYHEESLGSGAVLSKDGLIITNWHVVNGIDEVGVIFKPSHNKAITSKNAMFCGADVVKTDEVSDLALIQLSDCDVELKPLSLGSASDLEVGEDLHAIGHPHGLDWTYTQGVVSKIREEYEWPAYKEGGLEHKAQIVIQTQTDINGGNSGGPLLNDDGKIVGINSFGDPEGAGLNFAVSVEDVQDFIADYKPQKKQEKDLAQKVSEHFEINAVKAYREDFDDDGIVDLIAHVDGDENGLIELVVIWPGDEDLGMTLIFDDDEDGAWDEILIDSDNNGEYDLHLYDQDKDGKEDVIGYDDDEDGEVDRFEKID